MSARAIRLWAWLHKWSSLVCTAFMLLLCLTGLPLIFHHEIEHLTGDEVRVPTVADEARRVPLDDVLAVARTRYPQRVVQYVSQQDDGTPLWFVTMTPTPAPTADFVQVVVDARTGAVVPSPPIGEGFMAVMERLHVDLFAGLPGKLFLGAMGLLLAIAIVSGVVLYGPFMRKLPFGTVRHAHAPRIRWLDIHNLLGIVTMAWLLVVGLTGVLHTAADLVHAHWQRQVLQPMLAGTSGGDALAPGATIDHQRVLDAALAAAPGMRVAFFAMPGTAFSTPRHITYYLRGGDTLTAKFRQAVLVDATTAQVTAAPQRPWYLTLLQLAEPLHFGDYAGLPMKLLWTLLDLASIVVLGSGLYLWLRRPGAVPARAAALRERAT